MTASATYYLDGAKVEGVPLNMADVQQVDVVKGPDSVLFGRAQPGGLVNVVTRADSSAVYAATWKRPPANWARPAEPPK